VTPLNFYYDKPNELAEMIELNRLLGAQLITFYNHTTGPAVNKVLQHYSKQGWVEVIPWRLPVIVDVWPPDPLIQPEIHYFAQLLALNDCLYRHMFSSRYVVFTDLDEFAIPRNTMTWTDMLAREFPCPKERGAFLFPNCFFRRDWRDDEHATDAVKRLQLVTQLKVNREDNVWPHFSRSKYMLQPRMIVQIGVHFVFEFLDRNVEGHCEVPHSTAMLHHYRLWEDEEGFEAPQVRDTTAHKYQASLVTSVTRTLKSTGLPRHPGKLRSL
jgi:hypothetical protein